MLDTGYVGEGEIKNSFVNRTSNFVILLYF
jgi:hypothetical protein